MNFWNIYLFFVTTFYLSESSGKVAAEFNTQTWIYMYNFSKIYIILKFLQQQSKDQIIDWRK